MKFKTEVKKQVEVEFIEPEKTLDFFLNSDWKEVFFILDDLKEIAEFIAHQVGSFESYFGEVEIDGECEYRRYYRLEGLPTIIKEPDSNLYKMTDGEIGDIHIYVDNEYEVDYIEECNIG